MKKFEYVIIGGGESGVGCALLAAAKGYSVFVSDSSIMPAHFAEELRNAGIWFEQGAHTPDYILNTNYVIKSPGVPHSSNIIQKVMAKGIPVMSELDFASLHTKAKIIAITGTNGKTTTTSMIYDMLYKAGKDVSMAGNIGVSYARSLSTHDPDYFVLEVSSFQLDDVKTFKPHIAVLTNLTPDHLDRYEYDYDKYIKAKFNITAMQSEGDFFIYNADDHDTLRYLDQVPHKVQQLAVSYYQQTNGAYHDNGLITILDNNHKIYTTMNIQHLSLKGIHNAYNSMATAVVGKALMIKKEVIRESLYHFQNVEHRLELVANVGGVAYINDSKATNVNAVWYALESVEKPIIWIAGGVDKGNDYASLLPLVKEKVKLLICLGLDNTKLHQAFSKHIDLILNTQSMLEAVKLSNRFSEKGDTVLLSPACASFDLFLNYRERGWEFKKHVKNL
jgi:UDP-N-acetylmuramoylalanine--D-glutamate ligase